MKIPILPILLTYSHPWLYYWYQYTSLHRYQTMIHLRNGLKFFVRPTKSDLNVLNEIFIEKQYQHAIPHLPRQYGLVVDIGTHIGSFSILISKYAKKVISFEPEKDNFNLLKLNLKANQIKNVVALNFGISANSGNKELMISPTNGGGNSIQGLKVATTSCQSITCVNINEEIEKQQINIIDLLKMDCEGSEYEILNSLNNLSWKKIKAFIIEYHEWRSLNHYHHELIEILNKHGFIIQHLQALTQTTGIIYATKQ